jgi:hypothetical protein
MLKHNLAGDPDQYVGDLQFFDLEEWGQNQQSYGGDTFLMGEKFYMNGAYWYGLTKDEIRVFRGNEELAADRVRVRIWVYN